MSRDSDSMPAGPDSVGALSARSNPLVRKAVDTLCQRFELHGYNPTPIIDLGVIIAAADGKIDDPELKALRALVGTLLHTQLGMDVVGHLVQASREVLEQAGMEPRVRLVAEILDDCGAAEPGLTVALAIAHTKGGLNDKERAVIKQLARTAHVTEERLAELIAEVEKAGKSAL